ncbi:MAG: TRAP transporter substrate-binding protein [Armatimonadetes bacterium]|nr:TRAP transporter substrate-binding protein [Armatimonadota bacterium]
MQRSRLFALSAAALILIAAIALAPVPHAGAQQKIIIRFGHVGFPDSLFDLTAREYAKRVNQELGGRVEMRVFHSSQLGTDEDMIRGVRVGALEMFLPSTIMSSVDDAYGVFEMPYIIVNRRHMKNVAESPEVKKFLFDPQPVRGLRLLGFWENGFRHVTNNVRAINKPDDLRGIKLRIPRGVWRQKMFQAYGANPTPMAFAEVFSALQTGVMDGQENPLAQIWGAKFHEVQRYLSMTGHVYTPAYPTAGERWWQSVPADIRIVLRRIAEEVGDVARAGGDRLDNSLIADMQKANPRLQVNDVDKRAFIAASEKIYEEFAKTVPNGPQLIRLIQSLR